MMSTSTIFQKGLILVGIPLVSQAMFLITFIKMRSDQAEAQQLALHTGRVIRETEKLYVRLSEAHSALRGYAITADPRFVAEFEAQRRELAHQTDALRDLVDNNPEQRDRLAQIGGLIERLSLWQDNLRRLIDTKGRAAATVEIKTLQGRELLAGLREAFDEFLAVEQNLNTFRLNTLDRQATLQNWVLYAGGMLALASTCLLGFVFARSIAGRVSVLTENARRLAAGEELLAPLGGTDELARVDHAFRDMAEALAHKDRENEMFVYSVSHDLRSPLVNLQGFSQELALSCQDLRELVAETDGVPDTVRKRAGRLIDGQVGEAIQFIQAAVTRLAGIIDALLRLSRAGRVEYRLHAVEVGQVVQRVVGALQNTLQQKNAAVTVGDLPAVWGDPTALEQVFANLIGNAANYLDPARPGRIEVGAAPPESPDQQVIFVRDNGLGIPAEHQGKVFLAFQRLHPDQAQGEGIGLTLVRRVVERHGGKIWFESAAGAGTTFYVALPTRPPATSSGT